MKREDLKVGGRYNWEAQPERLVYLGKHQDHPYCRCWFQFSKLEEPGKVWCEVRPEDLVHFEVTPAATASENSSPGQIHG